MSSPPTAVVLGASGYIGSVLTGLLAHRPVRLRPVVRGGALLPRGIADIDPVSADLTDRDALVRAVEDADVVFHMAKHSGDWRLPEEDRDATRDVNVGVMETLLDVMATKRRSGDGPAPVVVFAGACTQVGRPPEHAMDGSEPDHPDTEYDRQKLEAENLLKRATADGTVRGVALRLATVFGQGPVAGKEDAGVVSTMIRRAIRGEPLSMWHDGSVMRDITYVEDVARAFLAAADYADDLGGRHWMIGNGVSRPLLRVFQDVAEAVALANGGPAVPVVQVPPPESSVVTDFHDVFIDPTPFEKTSGWSARVTFREGADRTVASLLRTFKSTSIA